MFSFLVPLSWRKGKRRAVALTFDQIVDWPAIIPAGCFDVHAQPYFFSCDFQVFFFPLFTWTLTSALALRHPYILFRTGYVSLTSLLSYLSTPAFSLDFGLCDTSPTSFYVWLCF